MGSRKSESRVRKHHRGVRFNDWEIAQLQAAADEIGTTVPELIRASLFQRPVEERPSCGPAHGKNCHRHHFNLVQGYRLARHDEEITNEHLQRRGEAAHFKAMGGELITFGDWLNAHKGEEENGNQEAAN